MKALAVFFAFVVMAIGLVLVVAADRLVAVVPDLERYVLTPGVLFAIGALRVGMGLVLFLVARSSRAPAALRAIGVVLIAAGLATPVFGVQRSRAVADWAARNTLVPRAVGVLLLALGSFIVFAVSNRRQA
jgi:hypothetical protein